MKKTNDRHGNRYGRGRRRTGISCLKRAGIIGLSMLIAATSDTSVTEALMVRAEEEKSKQCVITSFMPLPEDIATQTACTGTELEELRFPDTLEATGSYEEVPDDSGEEKPEEGDTPEKEKPEDEKQPGKPEQDDPTGEDDQDKDKTDEKPEEGDAQTGEPSGDDTAGGGQAGEEPKEGDQPDDEVKDDNKSPEDQTGDRKPEAQEKDEEPETPTENKDQEDQKEEEKKDGESADSGASEGEPAPENPKAEEPSGDKSRETEQSGKTPADDNGSDETSGEAEQTAEARVYIDMLDDILSTVEDKVIALFNHVTVEENRIMLASNMAEAEQEADAQTLTQVVSVEPATWDCISEYDSETEGCYVFMPVLPEGYVLADGVAVPEIVVIISGQEVQDSIKTQKDVKVFAEEKAPVSGKCGSSVSWRYDKGSGTLKITGSGAMDDFNELNAPWRTYQEEIRSIEIGSGVTSIGNYAFFKCSSLSAASIPGGMASIGEAAFFECSSLTGIAIPDSVTSVGGSAFFNCSSLGEIRIPSGSKVDSLAFYGCSGVAKIEVPAGAAVAATAFEGCANAFLYFPKSLSLGATDGTRANIAYKVAGGNTSLEIVRVAEGLGRINFPVSVGGGTVWEANWNKYPAVEITHDGLEHRYADGSSECAVCGYQKAPEIRIDYINETLTGFETGKAYSYSIAGGVSGTLSADAGRILPIREAWFGRTISIAVQGVGNAQELPIPSRPAAPEGVKAQGVSASGKDGKLLNVSPTMEYSTKEDTDYKPVKGDSVDGLSAGTYYVRYKAVAETGDTKGAFHSLPEEVIIEAHKLEPEKTPEAVIDYEKEALIKLTGGAKYRIGIGETTGTDFTAKSDGSIQIEEAWFGKTISVIRTGDGKNTEDSDEQVLFIPRRPAAPMNIGTDISSGKADGALTGVTSAMVYRPVGSDKWLEITGTTVNNLKPGRYEIRYKATNKDFASETAVVIIASADRVKEKTPAAGIDYEKETLTGLKAEVTYLINDSEMEAEAGGIILLEEEWIGSTLRIVKVGDQINTDDSEPQELPIPPRPAAPEEVEAKPVTAVGKNDGKLVNVNKTMQYHRAADEEEDEEEETKEKWVAVSGTEVSKLKPGTYFIRIKAVKGKSFRSEAVERTVQEAELKPEAKPSAAIDYKLEKMTGLTKNTKYAIIDQYGNYLTDDDIKADKNGDIAIDESWMLGADIGIVRIGNQFSTEDSEPFKLFIPERPAAPQGIVAVDEFGKGAKNGRLLNVTSDMQYRKENAKEWTNIKGQEVNKLAPGVYYVRYRADQAGEKFASSAAEYTITAYERQQEPEPAAYISFAEEHFYSLVPGAFYKINNGKKKQADENGEIGIISEWMGKEVSIVKAGDGVTTSDSPPYSIFVPKRRSAPSGIKAFPESGEGTKDGKLTGLNDEMEYRPAGGEWMNVYGDTLESLAPGKYEIRLAYTDSEFVSKSVQAIIYAYGKVPQTPAQDKNDGSQSEDAEGEQSDETGSQNGSSQAGGSSGSGKAGSAAAGSKAAGGKQNGQEIPAEMSVSSAVEPQANEGSQPDQRKKDADGRFTGTAIADSGEDGSGSDGNADGGRQTGKTEVSAQGKDDGPEAAQKQNNAETDTETEKVSHGQYSTDGAVYTERARGRMSEFYNFVLDLADSRNPGWIAIILAEPFAFLLILIYLLGRKNREKKCQAEH